MGAEFSISVENGYIYIRRYGDDIEYTGPEVRRIAEELLEAADEASQN